VPRRTAEGCLQMALATATTLVSTTADQLSAAERVEELRVFVTAGQQMVASDHLDASTLGAMAEEAVALIGGEAGAVLRPVGGHLEIAATTENWRGTVGAHVRTEGTAAGRACQTGRTVVSPGKGTTSTLVLPLVLSGRTLGVLEVRLPATALPVSQERVARLDRFGRFISLALQRDDERLAVERAMAGYHQLNELAAALGAQTDIDGVSRTIMHVVQEAFSFQIAGLVLTSYGRDQADIALVGEVHVDEIDTVLGDIAGRDVRRDPFDTVRTSPRCTGSLASDIPVRDDWATVAVALSHGTLDIGWLFVARADGGRYNAQDRALLDGLAAHAGAAFGRASLFGRIRDDYAKTIAALSATLDASEHMPSGHSTRVMDYAMLIGEELGLPVEDVEQLRFAGLLHDVGKTGVPHEILLKPSKLTGDELRRVKLHSEFGASIVDQIEFLKSLTPVILHHHERWDGEGYPAGLSGESIPLLARILAVADSYDAISTKKAYGHRKSFALARKEVERGAGTQFDPRVVAALFTGLDRMAMAGSTGLLAPAETRGRPELLQ
jgi:putative nucleotidyltransferase with HDIG domain